MIENDLWQEMNGGGQNFVFVFVFIDMFLCWCYRIFKIYVCCDWRFWWNFFIVIYYIYVKEDS